jgi:hypothetical protein
MDPLPDPIASLQDATHSRVEDDRAITSIKRRRIF